VYKLYPACAEILWTIIEAYPLTVSLPALAQALWGGSTGPADEEGVTRVMVSKLRSAIVSSNWGLGAAFGQGLYLTRKHTSSWACYCGNPLRRGVLEAYPDKCALLIDGRLQRVPPTEARLCKVLLDLPEGGAAHTSRLIAHLTGGDLRTAVKQVEVQMHRLRKILAGSRWSIQVQWRQGYYIQEER
jgi:DNA-binding winged helix-turn-helix (wHTH) protein